MTNITIEYMIMIPILILQIFLFPIVAGTIMNVWVDQRKATELQEIAGHMGSSIQQVYYTMNHASISSGTLTASLDAPSLIENQGYTITIHNATDPNSSVRTMNLTLSLTGTKNQASTLVTLGENAVWHENSTVKSVQVSLINATKTPSSIWLSFIGGT